MGKRDKHQEQTRRENHERILHVLHDYEPHTITEISKLTKLQRSTIYKHVNTMGRSVIRERRNIRLGPLYPMPEPMVQGLYSSLRNWPDSRAPSEIVLLVVPGHTEKIDSDGHVNHIMQLCDSLRTKESCKTVPRCVEGGGRGFHSGPSEFHGFHAWNFGMEQQTQYPRTGPVTVALSDQHLAVAGITTVALNSTLRCGGAITNLNKLTRPALIVPELSALFRAYAAGRSTRAMIPT